MAANGTDDHLVIRVGREGRYTLMDVEATPAPLDDIFSISPYTPAGYYPPGSGDDDDEEEKEGGQSSPAVWFTWRTPSLDVDYYFGADEKPQLLNVLPRNIPSYARPKFLRSSVLPLLESASALLRSLPTPYGLSLPVCAQLVWDRSGPCEGASTGG